MTVPNFLEVPGSKGGNATNVIMLSSGNFWKNTEIEGAKTVRTVDDEEKTVGVLLPENVGNKPEGAGK